MHNSSATHVYGSETWTTTKNLEKKLRVTERAMERIMVDVKESIWLGIQTYEREHKSETSYRISKRNIGGAGHLARRQDNRWTHILINQFDTDQSCSTV